eukprot:9498841-Pyramimonas_sp.AAC.1
MGVNVWSMGGQRIKLAGNRGFRAHHPSFPSPTQQSSSVYRPIPAHASNFRLRPLIFLLPPPLAPASSPTERMAARSAHLAPTCDDRLCSKVCAHAAPNMQRLSG